MEGSSGPTTSTTSSSRPEGSEPVWVPSAAWVQTAITVATIGVAVTTHYVEMDARIATLDRRVTAQFGSLRGAMKIQSQWIERQKRVNADRAAREGQRKELCAQGAFKPDNYRCFNLPSDEELAAMRLGG